MKLRRRLWIISMCVVLVWYGDMVYAQKSENFYEVCDKGQMCRQMIDVLRTRQAEVTWYYPGIYVDMLQYKKRGDVDLYEDMSKIDAYVVGGVESIRISYAVREDAPVTFRIQYRTTLQQENYVSRRVRRLTKRIRTRSAYRRVRWAKDYLVRYMQYDRRYDTAYDAFRKRRGNCMAYSYAFLRLMQELEVPCVYVSSEHHAWNMVKLKNRWYYVDVTWEDTIRRDTYFLKGKNDFPGHRRVQRGLPEKRKIAPRRYIYKAMCK